MLNCPENAMKNFYSPEKILIIRLKKTHKEVSAAGGQWQESVRLIDRRVGLWPLSQAALPLLLLGQL